MFMLYHALPNGNVLSQVRFYRPKTLALPRKPKYLSRSSPRLPRLDNWAIIKKPLASERAIKQIEDANTLVLIVDIRSNKHQIKRAVEERYDCKVVKVRTLIRPDGQKKAYVMLKAH